MSEEENQQDPIPELPPLRKRGRPRKEVEHIVAKTPPAKKPRKRPKKRGPKKKRKNAALTPEQKAIKKEKELKKQQALKTKQQLLDAGITPVGYKDRDAEPKVRRAAREKLQRENDLLDRLIEESVEESKKQINSDPIDPSHLYRGSKNLPTANAVYNYTADMVLELKKCTDDIIYFAENYFFITNLDEGKKKKIDLYPAQLRALKGMVEERFLVLLASRQSGKCLQKKSTVKIRNKKTLEIEEVTVEELFERFENSR